MCRNQISFTIDQEQEPTIRLKQTNHQLRQIQTSPYEYGFMNYTNKQLEYIIHLYIIQTSSCGIKIQLQTAT